MTSKERILTAMRGGIPDTVPVQVGIYEQIPAKMTGVPWWDIFLYHKVDLWPYNLATIKRFQFDGYLYVHLDRDAGADDQRTYERKVVRQDERYHIQRTTVHTPDGDLWEERTYPRADSSTVTRGLIKDRNDFELYLKHFFPTQIQYGCESIVERKAALGELGVIGGTVGLPGLHHLTDLFDGRLERATYFCYDHPELVDEYCYKLEAQILRELEVLLDARPDYIQIGASGLLTLSSPQFFRRYSLPTLKCVTRMCKEAGIPSELHACGKARYLVEVCAEETALNSINPLQPPPMGDVELAEVKQAYGDRLCLKGNVGVTEPMLLGTPEDVERDVLRCLEAAKESGGYILFTEEQLGRDTPFENIERMIAIAREYGSY
jgi:uroporphyrinogen-III decarboxylase